MELAEEKCKHFSRKQGQNFISVLCVTGHMLFSRYPNFSLFTFCCVVWVTEHVIMFKEIFDKQDSIF